MLKYEQGKLSSEMFLANIFHLSRSKTQFEMWGVTEMVSYSKTDNVPPLKVWKLNWVLWEPVKMSHPLCFVLYYKIYCDCVFFKVTTPLNVPTTSRFNRVLKFQINRNKVQLNDQSVNYKIHLLCSNQSWPTADEWSWPKTPQCPHNHQRPYSPGLKLKYSLYYCLPLGGSRLKSEPDAL